MGTFAMLNFLIKFSLSVFIFFSAFSACAEQRIINNKAFEVVGVRISKSGSMQLADLAGDSFALTEQAIYVPAGTPLLLLKYQAKDSKRRGLTLAVTATGLLVYARTDGTHYFSSDGIARMLKDNEMIAIAQTMLEVKTENYGSVSVTPSEIYTFRYAPDNQIEILINKEKIEKKRYTTDEYVKVDVEAFSIVELAQLDEKQIENPFREYDALGDISQILENAVRSGMDEAKRKKFLEILQNGRLVSSKECNDEITMSPEVQAGLSFDTDVMFSPIKAKLGISGSYKQTTTLPKGIKFAVKRFARGERVVEFTTEQIFAESNCLNSMERQRMTIADGQNKSALIDSRTDIKPMRLGANLLPEYSCRSEYEQLMDFFTRQETLPVDAATLAIARFVRFKSPQNPSICGN
ncbi:hypothetical protein J2T08_001094 [Neorhizobium galegae]|uniref:hypothetical protein n=1 Tax=Neorhizobium galegae TaxID=399 RepID=UPI00277EA9EE|nr:hypothetical protein [Neorhizobium galegae]MDQ0133193.1 hypothetical protein [Neorhizobium galegae]